MNVLIQELPEDSHLRELPNVVLTPHASGLSPRPHERSADLLLENLGRCVAGKPPRNVVDERAGC
ncbi:MAG TPA: hypothetical protein VLC52_02285 [Anaerolineae bacterium]|nr:hypothetical protein [Anaerolineae bacterium]